jgi:hypothetical protein
MSVIIDSLNREFRYLNTRMDINLKYLDENRHLIDKRISDIDIMNLCDMGIDAVSYCKEKIREYDTARNTRKK